MSTQSIIIAPSGQRHVLDALLDLQNAGVVSDFAWVETGPTPEQAPDALDPQLLWVSGGTIRPARWTNVVNVLGVKRIRLLLLVPLGDPNRPALPLSAEQYYQYLKTPAGVDVRRTRVLIAYSGDSEEPARGMSSWYDVMLSPENTKDPTFAAVPWWSSPEATSGAIAVGVAVQAGIIQGLNEAPSDEEGIDSAKTIRVVRSFVRMADMHEIENELRSATLNVSDTVPDPGDPNRGSSVPAYADPLAATEMTAKRWADSNQKFLRTPLQPLPSTQVSTFGVGETLAAFFSFLWQAIIGAPGRWMDSLVHGTKAWAASTVASTVFGADSGIKVVVGGVDSDGLPADWRKITAAAHGVRARIPTGSIAGSQPVKRNFSNLWREMVAATCALLDSSPVPSLGLTQGGGYVPNRNDVIPVDGPSSAFVLPVTLNSSFPAGYRLDPWNVHEIDTVCALIQRGAHSGPPNAGATELLGQINQWRAANARRFIPAVGAHIVSWMKGTQSDLQFIARQLQQLRSVGNDAAHQQAQKRMGLFMRILLGVFLGVLLLLLILGLTSLLGWKVVVPLIVLALIAWFVTSMIVFVRGQREVFRSLATLRARKEELPILEANFAAAIDDLAALGMAYEQYLVWAKVLRGFVANPLGASAGGEHTTVHETILPAAVTREVFHCDPKAVSMAAAQLRMRIFPIGWVSEAWKSACDSLPLSLSPDLRIKHQAGNVHIENESGRPETALGQWAADIEQRGLRSERGAALWKWCLDEIGNTGAATLNPISSGSHIPFSLFRNALRQPEQMNVVEQLFTAAGQSSGCDAVTSTPWFKEAASGLSSTMVLVQSTREVDASAFVFGHRQPIPPDRPAPRPDEQSVEPKWQGSRNFGY